MIPYVQYDIKRRRTADVVAAMQISGIAPTAPKEPGILWPQLGLRGCVEKELQIIDSNCDLGTSAPAFSYVSKPEIADLMGS
jgi:hypothetical protein